MNTSDFDKHKLRRLLVCTACAIAMLTVTIAVVFAVGIELAQREKRRDWQEVLT